MNRHSSSPEWDSSDDGEQFHPDFQSNRTSNLIGVAEPPMPSLTSHPPLRLQRRPVAGTTRLNEIVTPGASPSSSPLPPRRTDSPPSQGDFVPALSAEDEPTFACQYCHVVFKKIGHLNRHTLKHVGTRFACEVPDCDKTFSRQDNMRTQYVLLSSHLLIPTHATILFLLIYSVKNMHPNHNLSQSPSPFIHHKVVRTPDPAMSGSSSQSQGGAVRTHNKASSRERRIVIPS